MKHKPALVVANWKLNPGTSTEAKNLALAVLRTLPKTSTTQVVVAPPTLYVPEVSKALKKKTVGLGVQNLAAEERGALTGEVSASLFSEYGVTHAIIGHSERRAIGETDALILRKTQAALKRRLTPIVCIGERERDQSGQYFNLIETQLRSLASGLKATEIVKVVIAYEPIWAIGTGVTPIPDDVKEMQLFIMSTLTKLYDRKIAARVRLLYGGSVKASNAEALHQAGDMNGFLVGGASLEPKEFITIIKATEVK